VINSFRNDSKQNFEGKKYRVEEYVGKSKIHPITGHEGPEGE
jgi:hypothetical protein